MDTTNTPVDTANRSRARDDGDLEPAKPCRPGLLDPIHRSAVNVERAEALAWMLDQMCWERRIDDLRTARTAEVDQIDASATRQT